MKFSERWETTACRPTREAARKLKEAGRSREEIVAATPTVAFDKKWGGFFLNGAAFTGSSTLAYEHRNWQHITYE